MLIYSLASSDGHSRIAKMRDGTCIIGMKSLAMIPLISFDTVVNVYLTLMFLVPMRREFALGTRRRALLG